MNLFAPPGCARKTMNGMTIQTPVLAPLYPETKQKFLWCCIKTYAEPYQPPFGSHIVSRIRVGRGNKRVLLTHQQLSHVSRVISSLMSCFVQRSQVTFFSPLFQSFKIIALAFSWSPLEATKLAWFAISNDASKSAVKWNDRRVPAWTASQNLHVGG